MTPALNFDLWGGKVEVNLIMSIILLATVAFCWIWYKMRGLNSQHEYMLSRNKKLKYDYKLKKRQQNLRLINYCPKCDQWMKQNYIAVFVCEQCGLERRTDTPIQQ